MVRKAGFLLVFSAFVLPSASHLLTVYALSFYLLERYAEHPGFVSIAELMNTLPVLAGFVLIGLAADRLHRKRLALASLLLRLLFASALLAAIHSAWIGLAFAMLFGRMFFHKLFVTMEMAILQGLLESHEFVKVASLKQFINGVLAITGSFAALYLYRQHGIEGVLAVDCACTAIAFALILKARIPLSAALPNGPSRMGRAAGRQLWQDALQGFAYVGSNRLLRSFLYAFLVFGIVNAMLATLPLFSIRYEWTDGVEAYQRAAVTFSFALGLAFVLGSLTTKWWSTRLNGRKIILPGLFAVGLLLTAMGLVTDLWSFYVIVFVAGFLIVMINIVIGGWLPQAVAPAYMGRAYSLLDPASLLSKSLGLALCGWLFPSLVPLWAAYLIFGFLLLLGTSFIWRLRKSW